MIKFYARMFGSVYYDDMFAVIAYIVTEMDINSEDYYTSEEYTDITDPDLTLMLIL